MKDNKTKVGSCAQPQLAPRPASKDMAFQLHGDILEETQRLIEEAELKLRFMEGGIHQNDTTIRPDIFSSFEEYHLLNATKNQKLKQALSNKMKKLEMQVEAKSKKQVTKSDSTKASDDHVGIASASSHPMQSYDQRSERVQQGRVRRPCRKSPEPDHDSQELIDVVRTARDSVQGALVAARRLSATLANRTPRTSKNSVSGASVRAAAETQFRMARSYIEEHLNGNHGSFVVEVPKDQVADRECARSCAEHGAKRKVCSCLCADFDGVKRGETKLEIQRGRDAASFADGRHAASKPNCGVFEAKCTAIVKEEVRGPQKRLQMSVMPSISIKRSLEKQVMPVIEVPFPGSTPEEPRRENIGVRNFRYIEPFSHRFVGQSVFKQQVGEESGFSSPQLPRQEEAIIANEASAGEDLNTALSIGNVIENRSERGISIQQLSQNLFGGGESLELSQSQVNELLQLLIGKTISSRKEGSTTISGKPPTPHDTKTEVSSQLKATKTVESASSSSQSLLQTDQAGRGDDSGNIAYSSLSRFLETYYKAAIATKRAKQKAAMRRKEDIRHMKEQEERFKSQAKMASSETHRTVASHNLIGPFKRAVKNGLRKDAASRDFASTSDQEALGSIADLTVRLDSVASSAGKSRLRTDCDSTLNERPHQSDEVEVSTKNITLSKTSAEENVSEGEGAERRDDLSAISRHSESSVDGSTSRVAAEPSAHTESNNDDYEDDWEEENDEEKIIEDSVETRDVGDGSERDIHDEMNGGVTHSLRTILEVEENSSQSVSLIHHEAPTHTAQSGTNRSDTSQPSFSKTSFLDNDEVKTSNKSQADDRRAQVDSGLSDVIRPREITFEKDPYSSELSRPILQPVQLEIEDVRKEEPPEFRSTTTVSAENKIESNKVSEEFSSSRAFLEMTEALKKMLETVVSNLVQNKVDQERPVPETSTVTHHCNTPALHGSSYDSQRPNPKRFSVRFSGGPLPHESFYERRSSLRRYDPTSSGSANDDRVSSGSEASTRGSYLRYRNLRWGHSDMTRRANGNRVRFKTGSKRSSATQTEDKNQSEDRSQPESPVAEEFKCDAETQVTPGKDFKSMETGAWGRPTTDELFLQQSKLSLLRTPLRLPTGPKSLSFDMDPTERLLAFGRSTRAGQLSFAGVLPQKTDHNHERTRSDSLSSSTSSLQRDDTINQPVNSTVISLSEGEVLAYQSCSCSEGELCPCNGRYRPLGSSVEKIGTDESLPNFEDDFSKPRSHRECNADSHTPWPSLVSTMREDDFDLTDQLSEGEIIEKLIGISNLLNGKKKSSNVKHHAELPNAGLQFNFDLGQRKAPSDVKDYERNHSLR